MFCGLILVAAGGTALLAKADAGAGSGWGFVWPAAAVVFGLSVFAAGFLRRKRGAGCPPWLDREVRAGD